MDGVAVQEKVCASCLEAKAYSEFPIVKSTGKAWSYCFKCRIVANSAYREKRKAMPRQLPSITEKRCVTCSEIKPVSEFSHHLLSKDGIRGDCKACCVVKATAWYRANRRSRMNYYIKNRERYLQRCKAYNKRNMDKLLMRQKCRYATDPGFSLKRKMAFGMRRSLKNGKSGQSWSSLVSYTMSELKDHLLKTMPDGYTWDDFLSGRLHIDHIIPVSAFNITSPDDIDFQRCWALKNLRLLGATENISKSGRLDTPFQPSFAGI